MLPEWVTPTVIGALGIIIWYLARRIMEKQDEIAKAQGALAEAAAVEASKLAAQLSEIKLYMQSELRQFDVRLSVVETLVLPHREQYPQQRHQ